MPPPRERDSRRLAAAVALCVGCGTQDATPEPLCPAVSDCQPILFPLRPRIDQLELGDPEEGDIGLDLRSGAVLHIHTDAAGALRSLDQFRLTNSPRHILYEDLDGDGAKDIAVTDTHADRVVVALRRADGRFADAQEIVVPDGPAALAVWSDAGGERRLLVASSRASSLWTITMRADQPPAPVESAVLQPGVSVIAAVDLDLDGVQDLVTLNPSERQVAILTHEDGSWRTTHTVPQPLAASRLRLGRFNDDQYTDLLLIDDATQTAHVLLRAPDGTFATPGLPLDSPGPVLDAIVWPDGADRERPTLLVENFGVVDSPLGEPAALRGLTSWHATSLARTPSGDGALAVVARDTGRITRASTRADALSLGTSSTLDTVGTSTPLAAIDVTGDALPEIIAHESKQLVVFPALSTSTWGSGTPLETGTEAEPAAVLPIRLDLDDHVDLLVLDKGSRISALQGLGDGTFLHPETYVLWGSGVDASVADLIGDARSEIVVTRRDLPGHPRELWQLDGSNWTSQALPGAGGRPVVVRSITDSGPDLVFASSHSDGDPAFVERVHIDAGVWHLGPRTALPAHVARSAPIEDNDSNGALAFCTHAPEDGRSSVGLVSIDADGGLSVQHQALEPTSVLHDGEALEFSGGDCQALWSEQTADTADLFAAFGFTGSEINSIYVASVFELSTSGFAHYRNDYLRHAESLTVLPLISGGERSRVLTKASLLTRLHEVEIATNFVPRLRTEVWPEPSESLPWPLPAPIGGLGPGGFLVSSTKASTVSIVASRSASLNTFTVPCPSSNATLIPGARALVACDDGSLYRIAAEAPPLKLGQLTHRADSMIAWNGSSGLHLFVGDQVSSKIHAYGLDFGGSALTSLTAAETTVPPIWLRSMSMSGSDRLLIGAPGEDTIMLLDPDSLVEGVAPELDLIKVPPTSRMELGDVDGDDSTELVALQEKRLLIISLSETSSRVIAEISLSPEADIDGPLAIWDADCDGHLDVAVRSRSMKQVIAWRGDGLGGFEPVGELYSPDSLHFLVGGPRCSRSGQSLLGIGEAEVFLW